MPAILAIARRLAPLGLACCLAATAQTPPSARDLAAYPELFLAAANADQAALERVLADSPDIDRRDGHGRSALHVAAFYANHAGMRSLVAAGADPNALENDFYDIATIAAVADDVETLELALRLGCNPANVTSLYRGTALIAAAHLGHAQVVEILVAAGAPLDHVNNLGWTALIESIVLGDGGARHIATLQALVEGGADVNLADNSGRSPLQLAADRGYTEMARILRVAGGD